MSSLSEVQDLIESGGVTPAKFEQAGATVTGKVIHLEAQQQRELDSGKPKFWDDGKPRMQIVAHLETGQRDPQVPDDDGKRAVYIRGNMLKALRVALKHAGGARLETGGILTIRYTGDGEQARKGFNPPKLYDVTYAPPAAPGIATVNEVLGTAQQPAPAAPAPAAPQQPAAAGPPAPPPGPERPADFPAEAWDRLDAEARKAVASSFTPF